MQAQLDILYRYANTDREIEDLMLQVREPPLRAICIKLGKVIMKEAVFCPTGT
jgi:hypothetical protein